MEILGGGSLVLRLKAEACTEERHSLQERTLVTELDRVKRQLSNVRVKHPEYRLDLDIQVEAGE